MGGERQNWTVWGFNPQLFPISIPLALLPISILSTISLSHEGGVPEPEMGRFCFSECFCHSFLHERQSATVYCWLLSLCLMYESYWPKRLGWTVTNQLCLPSVACLRSIWLQFPKHQLPACRVGTSAFMVKISSVYSIWSESKCCSPWRN